MIKVSFHLCLTALSLAVFVSCGFSEEKLADSIVGRAKAISPKLQAIDELIDAYGTPEDYPSAKALWDLAISLSPASLDEDYPTVVHLMLEDLQAYVNLQDDSTEVQSSGDPDPDDFANAMFCFCNDTVARIKNARFENLVIQDGSFSTLADREQFLDLFRHQRDSLPLLFNPGARYKKLMGYLENLEYLVFVNFEYAMLPQAIILSVYEPGAIGARVDVYRLADKSLCQSVKTFEVSSEFEFNQSLKSPRELKTGDEIQRILDEDLDQGIKKAVLRALSEHGMTGGEEL